MLGGQCEQAIHSVIPILTGWRRQSDRETVKIGVSQVHSHETCWPPCVGEVVSLSTSPTGLGPGSPPCSRPQGPGLSLMEEKGEGRSGFPPGGRLSGRRVEAATSWPKGSSLAVGRAYFSDNAPPPRFAEATYLGKLRQSAGASQQLGELTTA